MRWLLDVNITKGVENFLLSQGHDIETLIQLGLRKLSNGKVLEKAAEKNRILLSYDKDFIRLVQGKHPGVVVLDIHPSIDENVVPLLKKALNELDHENIKNQLVLVEKDKIIRRKPD